ncbi:RIP metalloprotease [Austwickia sp. TVS 96-490-7B]|uniref:M50 family metallopeptidase n=1 Tax=Austwickia sp. TVS 96-490-7B TaxID=2830843 RepID=UPI001C571F90|nr:site-2 protease family protein [Austwickia sp. TVS 96-490-7B]
MYVLGVLFIAFGIGLSIALHELGHLIPAKLAGVRCSQYMIGFGPTLWSRQIGDTQYGFKAIPLGGYVRMIGMLPPKPGDPDGLLRGSSTGRLTALIDDARAYSMEEIGPGDENRVFYKLSTWRKLSVMLGGPMMNLVVATVIITGITTLYGQQVPVDGAKVGGVVQCVKPLSATDTSTCGAGDPQSPAAKAGLRPEDVIVAIDGTTVRSSADVSRLIRPQADKPVPFVVRRGDQELKLTITPMANQVPELDEKGQAKRKDDGSYVLTTAGYIGTSTGQNTALERQSITKAPQIVADGVVQTASVVLRLPQKLVQVWDAAFGSAPRDTNSPMSVVGVGRVAGDVASTMSFMGVKLSGPAELLVILLMLLASLNIALFVFNLIPLMPLDGGQIAGALWEALKRGFARLRGAPDPGYVDVAKGMPLSYAMTVVLIGMSVLLIYADLVKPIKL